MGEGGKLLLNPAKVRPTFQWALGTIESQKKRAAEEADGSELERL